MKQKKKYICSNCEYVSPKWMGKCPHCNSWDSFTEHIIVDEKSKKINLTKKSNITYSKLSEISTEDNYRYKSGIEEFDRVLGGGLVPGSLVLLAGEPGIGKSTLTLQISSALKDFSPLYVTGEESLSQIKYRSERLENINSNLKIIAETNLDEIISLIINDDSKVIIIDSIQSTYIESIESTPGSITQVRECTAKLMQLSKRLNKAMIIIGHVNKEGHIAGPKILEHMVDTVLQFEGDNSFSYRVIRSIKNRYGSTNEIGIFEMTNKGLVEVSNPSEFFLSGNGLDESGVAIVSSLEGNRPILLEVQALVAESGFSVPQRTATGIDTKRLQMIIAVLEKRLGANFFRSDIFVNIAGGMRLNDTSTDLGIAAALISSLKDITIDKKTVFIGEVGLTGEVRAVSNIEQKILEAKKLGFKRFIIPELRSLPNLTGIDIFQTSKISAVINEILK